MNASTVGVQRLDRGGRRRLGIADDGISGGWTTLMYVLIDDGRAIQPADRKRRSKNVANG